MEKKKVHTVALAVLLAASMCGCVVVQTGVRVVGTDLPDGPLEMTCESYGSSFSKMANRVQKMYSSGWRIVFAVQRDYENTFGGMGKSEAYVCYVPSGGTSGARATPKAAN